MRRHRNHGADLKANVVLAEEYGVKVAAFVPNPQRLFAGLGRMVP